MTCEIVTIERPTPRVVFAKIKKTNVASIINMSGFTNMQIHTYIRNKVTLGCP